MIPGFSFAFERRFGLDSVPTGLPEPFVNPSRLCRILGLGSGRPKGADQRNGPRHVHYSQFLRALTLGTALGVLFAANLTATPAHAGASILVEAAASGPTRQALLRFDSLFGSGAGQIPIGSTIASASLVLWVGQGASTLAPVELHRMQIPWNAATATWNAFNANGTPGIQTDGVEALTAADGSVGAISGTGYRVIGGLAAALQAW